MHLLTSKANMLLSEASSCVTVEYILPVTLPQCVQHTEKKVTMLLQTSR